MPRTPALLRWLDDPLPGSVHFPDGPDWARHSQYDLAAGARAAAAVLSAAGVRRDDPVLLALGTNPAFVHAFFGTIGIGAVPTAIQPPGLLARGSAYEEQIGRIVAGLDPRVVVCEERLAETITRAAGSATRVLSSDTLDQGDPATALPGGGRYCLAQLTSGSTGVPKPVLLTAEQVSDHVTTIAAWLDIGAADVGVSWLPFHHDMGLVGHLLVPLIAGIDEFVMSPLDFLRRPASWLETIGRYHGTITAAPTFGYAYAADRVEDAEVVGLDLSSCKAAIVGAERVDPKVLARFAERFAAHGLAPSALLPAYGLAEATLAVTGTPLGDGIRQVRLPAGPAEIGQPLAPIEPGDDHAPEAAPVAALVACGAPLPGTTVRIEDDAGTPLPDAVLGEIVVTAASVGDIGPAVAAPAAPGTRRRLRTGDAGFVLDGWLYVVGRLGDSLSVFGRRVFAEALEADVAEHAGVVAVVVMGDDVDGPTVVTLVEGDVAPPTATTITGVVAQHAGPGVRGLVVAASRGAISRTTSGKPRRRALWDAYVSGRPLGRIVAPEDDRARVPIGAVQET